MGEGEKLDLLIRAAAEAARGMGAAAGEKPNEAPVQSDARTFRGLATMLTGLSEEADRRERQLSTMSASLSRIACLQVRGATELIERGDWRRLAGELQTIAQEAITAARTTVD
jgi:hypothetical protein